MKKNNYWKIQKEQLEKTYAGLLENAEANPAWELRNRDWIAFIGRELAEARAHVEAESE